MSIRTYLFLVITIGIVAQVPMLQPWLAWDRNAILQGEIWRILTGNLTHTNWAHLLMNALALLIISFIFRDHFNAKRYTALIIVLSIGIGGGIFATNMQWYAGLSGVLHGIFAWGAINDIRTKTKGGWLLLVGLIIKIAWEQTYGGSASSEALIGARVATEAHLIGALIGTSSGFINFFSSRQDPKKQHNIPN